MGSENYGIELKVIDKIAKDVKHFGVMPHDRLDMVHPLTKGFDDVVHIPVSRYTEIDKDENPYENVEEHHRLN